MNNDKLDFQQLFVSWNKFCEKQEVELEPFYCKLPGEWAKFTSSASPYPYPVRPLSDVSPGVTGTITSTSSTSTTTSSTTTTL